MSGDVQPRKRNKDKKQRRREDSDNKATAELARKMSVRIGGEDDDVVKPAGGSGGGVSSGAPVIGVQASKMGTDDIQLHVHSDHGTGGHWCAKIFFFSLMAVLAGLVGLILLENRGSSDLDTPLSESRFADYLEGWVEEKRDSHDEHDVLKSLNELDEHDHDNEPFSEEEDHDEDDEEHDAHDNEDHDNEDHDDEDHDDEDHDDENEETGSKEEVAASAAEEEENEDEVAPDVADPEDDEDDDDQSHEDDDDQSHEDADEDEANAEEPDDDDDDNEQEEADKPDVLQRHKRELDEDDDVDEGFEEDGGAEEVDENVNDESETAEEVAVSVEDDKKEDNDDDDDDDPFDEHATDRKELDCEPPQKCGVHNVNVSRIEVEKPTNTVSAEELKRQVDDLYATYNKLAETLDRPLIVENLKSDDMSVIGVMVNENDAKTEIESLQTVSDKSVRKKDVAKEDDDDDASFEQVIDNDEGEELHLQKLAQHDESVASDDDDDDQPQESSSRENGDESEKKATANQVDETVPFYKRRQTLVTADEPIPSDVDDTQPNDDDDYNENDEGEDDDDYDEEGAEDDDSYEGEYSEEDIGDLDDEPVMAEPIVPVPRSFEEMQNMYQPKRKVDEPEQLQHEKASVTFATRDQVKTIETPVIENEVAKSLVNPSESPDALGEDDLADDAEVDENDGEEKAAASDAEDDEEAEGSEEEEEDDDEDEEEEDVDDDEEVPGSEEELSDVDDADLMKRLESKYGKLAETTGSDEEHDEEIKRGGGGAQSYDPDDDIADELRRANGLLEDLPAIALKQFDQLLLARPDSPGALLGQAQSFDRLADLQKNNVLLDKAIDSYRRLIVDLGEHLPDDLYKTVTKRCIDKMRFKGQHGKAVAIHELIIARFNDDPYHRNQLAVTHLLGNRMDEAKAVLHDTLFRWRDDGFAAVHYGFVVKNLDNNMELAVTFLREGIDSGAEGTNDGRFYFTLGDALARLGRYTEARQVYQQGTEKGLFLSSYQRSLYNVERLQSHPIWKKTETGDAEKYFDVLEQNWERIRDEGMSVLNKDGHFTDESENLRDTGDWKQFDLFARGRKVQKHCDKTPFTCKIIDTFPAARFCTRGQVKFSVMHPGTHVWPHCGPTNCRIRAHLGLQVPPKTYIRVADKLRSWKNGKMLIFDDSFEHEVWHNGTSVRLVLIVDIWHPDLTDHERQTLSPI